MLPTSRPTYRFGDDKENVPLDIKSSRYSESLSSSIWGTDEIFNIWKTPALVTPLTEPKNIDYVQTKTYLNPSDSVESHSPHSSGYGSFNASPWSEESLKIFANELTRPIDDLFKPREPSLASDEASYSSMSSTSFDSSFSYSLLSSCSSSDNGSPKRCLADLTFEEFNKFTQPPAEFNPYDELRRDFEMNGKTLEVEEQFIPQISSTPMVNRRQANAFMMENALNQPIFYPSTPSPPRNQTFQRQRRPRRKFKPNKKSLEDHCVFCKNNGASEIAYRTHTVKDSMGRVLCPVLRQYKCPICGEDGDKSHTVKYCPKKPIITPEDLARMDVSQF